MLIQSDYLNREPVDRCDSPDFYRYNLHAHPIPPGRPVMIFHFRHSEHTRGKHEDYTDKNLVNHIYPPVLDSYNHSGFTLRDTLIMHNWLAYGATIGDLSYMEISGIPVEKLSIDKRPPFQAAKE